MFTPMMDNHNRLAFLFNTTKTSPPTLSGGLQVSGFTANTLPIQDGYQGPITSTIDYSGSAIDPNGIDMWFVGAYHDPIGRGVMKLVRVNFERKVFLPFIVKEDRLCVNMFL